MPDDRAMVWHVGDMNMNTMKCVFFQMNIMDIDQEGDSERFIFHVDGVDAVIDFWSAVERLDRNLRWSVRFMRLDQSNRLLGTFNPSHQTYIGIGEAPTETVFWRGPEERAALARPKRLAAKRGPRPGGARRRPAADGGAAREEPLAIDDAPPEPESNASDSSEGDTDSADATEKSSVWVSRRGSS